MKLIFFILIIVIPTAAKSKKPVYRRTQNVSFDGSDIDGVVKSPDGSFLHQKVGIKFLPIYKVRKRFDKNIKASVNYLR